MYSDGTDTLCSPDSSGHSEPFPLSSKNHLMGLSGVKSEIVVDPRLP